MQAGLETRESCWYLLRLCSLTTIQREWCALHAFPGLPFKDTLLRAALPGKPAAPALAIPEVPLLPAPSHLGSAGKRALCIRLSRTCSSAPFQVTFRGDRAHAAVVTSQLLSSQCADGNGGACGQDLRGCCVRVQAVQQAMKAEYNDSQMAAVTAGLDRSPVVLIQVSSC